MPMKRSKFFLVMSGLFLTIVLVGFTRSLYLSSYFEFPDLPFHLILHGIVLTIWFSLAALQPILIARNKTKMHKTLGLTGYSMIVAVVAVSLLTLLIRDIPTIDEFPGRSSGNLLSLFIFSFCAILGLRFRSKPAMHKRLMILASIPILAPATDRVIRIPVLNDFFGKILFWFPGPPEIAFATIFFLGMIIAVVVNDLISEKRVHAGTLWGLGIIFIVAPAATAALTLSGAWAAFVRLVV